MINFISDSMSRYIRITLATGLVLTLIGLVLSPERGWYNLLLVANYVTGLGVAGLVFVAIHYVSGASWGTVFRRVPEAMWILLPIGFVLMLCIIPGMRTIYEWANPEHVAHDAVLQSKAAWLNTRGYIFRLVLWFMMWMIPGWLLLRNSSRQDIDGKAIHTKNNVGLSALWLMMAAGPFIIGSFDWIMSLEPHWYSTIFAFYNFSGMFSSGLALIIILLIIIDRSGLIDSWITHNHLHELGRFLFAMTTFWVYIWFSQHMLIWYANIPEETAYYMKRHFGIFGTLAVINVVINWLIPFSILLFRKTKRSDKSMLTVAIIVLVGRWLDLYLMIFPARPNAVPVVGPLEIGSILVMGAVVIWAIFRMIALRGAIPINDPKLLKSRKLSV